MKTPLHIAFLVLAVLSLSNCGTGVAEIKRTKESQTGLLQDIHAPKKFTYRGQDYTPGYSAHGSNGAIVEYYKAGEGPNQWTSMLAVRRLDQPTTAEAQTKAMADRVSAKGLRFRSLINKKSGETTIDFMLPHSGDLEFNLFRYRPLANGQGVTSFQYIENIPKSRLRSFDGMAYTHKQRIAFFALPFPYLSRTN